MCNRVVAVALIGAWLGCSESSPVELPLEEFSLEQTERRRLETAQQAGGGAQGSYAFDEGSGALSIAFSQSSFKCEGRPTAGEALKPSVTSLTSTTMSWNLDGDVITFTRADAEPSAPTVVGVWLTEDDGEDLYVLMTSDSATVIADDSCEPREKSEENCDILTTSGFAISIDGDLSDWDAIPAAQGIENELEGSAPPGQQVRALKLNVSEDVLYVLMGLHGPPDTTAQDLRYRLYVGEGNGPGASGGSLFVSIYYNGAASRWELADGQGAGAEVSTGSNGIEFSIPLFSSGYVSMIRTEVQGCSASGCEGDDISPCAAYRAP